MGPVKLPFAESDLAPLVKRYTSSTIVTMLREVAKCKSARLNWAMLCKGTATGITNPREYQALWRSIAYRADLDDSLDGNDSPLEDDSDMEVDLDPLPSVSAAVAESICSYVKSDLQQHELEDARLEQNAVQAGTGHQAGDVATARLQPCSATHGESTASLAGMKVPCSAAMNQSDSRKRRRLWTPEEDLALIAAVDKCGEGNWTAVLKNHYDFDRSASQLSQRWALIRKRREVQEKAGYGIGSGVSPLASGYKDLRPEGLKSATPTAAGSQPGPPKEVAKLGTVPMPIKQPVSSSSSVPVSKRIPVASAQMGAESTSVSASHASVLETQRVRALPAPGVSSSWAGAPGPRPQAHGHHQTSMRGSISAAAAATATALGAAAGQQVHKGGIPEGSHAHTSGVRRPQVFYTSTQSATSTIPIDSKYAASRNMGAGVAPRGGASSKGGHGPDPMIQAAAMAAGARIAPASAAASLLKAAQSGNVVHIGSGGLARSKLGLTSQAGSGNAGGNPGIVHYIRTGSGGASLAATSSGLQRASSHHMTKNQPTNRSFGSSNNSGSHNSAGNSSPLTVPTVSPAAAQASRNSNNNNSNNNNNPQAPVQSSKPASLSKRGCSPQQKSTSAPPTLTSTLVTTPPIPSSSTTAPTPPAPSSSTTSTPAYISVPAPVPKSAVTPGSTTSTSTPLSTSRSIPSSAPPSTARSIPASTSASTPPAGTLASGSASTPSAPSSVPAPPASTSKSTLPAAASAPTPASLASKTALPPTASASTPAPLTSKPTPASSSSSLPIPASIAKSTPASSTSVSIPASISRSTSASTTKSVPSSTTKHIPATALSGPASTSVSIPASTSKSIPASSTSASAATPIPACSFNTAEQGVDSLGDG